MPGELTGRFRMIALFLDDETLNRDDRSGSVLDHVTHPLGVETSRYYLGVRARAAAYVARSASNRLIT